jgi:hypothetical protein
MDLNAEIFGNPVFVWNAIFAAAESKGSVPVNQALKQ